MTTSTPLVLLSLVAAWVGGGEVSPQLREELHKLYPVRGVVWEDVRQSFWSRSRVLKLRSTAEPGAYHRPTVAVDASGKAHVLTDGFFIVPPESPLREFNIIALNEGVQVAEDNISDYARFFLESYLLIGDDYCLSASVPVLPSDGPLPDALCSSSSPFTVMSRRPDFHIDTVLVNRKGRWATPHRFAISADGRVAVRP